MIWIILNLGCCFSVQACIKVIASLSLNSDLTLCLSNAYLKSNEDPIDVNWHQRKGQPTLEFGTLVRIPHQWGFEKCSELLL
jgi:hypothetical protein